MTELNSDILELIEGVGVLAGIFLVVGSVGANETGSIGDMQLLVQCLIGFALMTAGIPIELISREIAKRKSRKANAKKRGKAA